MKTAALFALTLAASLTANADFSYTTTQKMTGGSMAAMVGAAADRVNKVYFKGQKMVTSSADSTIIIDFGVQTITSINNTQKTYTVKKFSDLGAAGANADVSVDTKETGQTKSINGFNANEVVVTMSTDIDMGGRGAPPMKMQMELDMWVSTDVPGSGEVRAFYQKNAANFPWAAMAAGNGNASIQKAIAQLQRKMSEMKGVVVEQVIRVKPGGGMQMPQMPQMTPEQQAQMQAAMQKMQASGQNPAAMQQMMANMGRGGAAGGSGSLMEITSDSSGFSSADVPDSVFAIPAGYKQGQ
jgi:hypothetical protein